MQQADSNSNLTLKDIYIQFPEGSNPAHVSLGEREGTFPSFDVCSYFLNTSNCKAETSFSYAYLLAAILLTHPCDGTLHPNKDM